MLCEKAKKRALRIVGALAKAGGRAPITPQNGTTILGLAGGRTIRCPASLLDHMVAAGWLDRATKSNDEAAHVMLTKDGETWRSRWNKGGDFGTQHREQVASTSADSPDATINLSESPLARLARSRGHGQAAWLNRAQLEAGDRLRGDFEFARLQPKVTASWDPSHTVQSTAGGTQGQTPTERAMDARRRLNNAIEAVGPELSGVLLDVCCFLKGLEQVEMERGWPRRSAKVVLRTALDALDRHYNPPARPARARNRQWGTPDYRPSINC